MHRLISRGSVHERDSTQNAVNINVSDDSKKMFELRQRRPPVSGATPLGDDSCHCLVAQAVAMRAVEPTTAPWSALKGRLFRSSFGVYTSCNGAKEGNAADDFSVVGIVLSTGGSPEQREAGSQEQASVTISGTNSVYTGQTMVGFRAGQYAVAVIPSADDPRFKCPGYTGKGAVPVALYPFDGNAEELMHSVAIRVEQAAANASNRDVKAAVNPDEFKANGNTDAFIAAVREIAAGIHITPLRAYAYFCMSMYGVEPDSVDDWDEVFECITPMTTVVDQVDDFHATAALALAGIKRGREYDTFSRASKRARVGSGANDFRNAAPSTIIGGMPYNIVASAVRDFISKRTLGKVISDYAPCDMIRVMVGAKP